MIFAHTYQQVLDGTKTQTRRLVKPEDMAISDMPDSDGIWGVAYPPPTSSQYDRCYSVTRWHIGQTRAVQPGRGQKAVARIRITAIRREDVRQISDEDVKAEGFASRADFLRLWEQMHGQHYDAWVLTFELVTEVQS